MIEASELMYCESDAGSAQRNSNRVRAHACRTKIGNRWSHANARPCILFWFLVEFKAVFVVRAR